MARSAAYAPKGAWRGFGRQSGSDIGRMAIRVYICTSCNCWHERTKPAHCLDCGMMAFEAFDSKTEAKRWMALLMLRRSGRIADLRRQVSYPLMALGPDSKPHKFSTYVADFVYTENDETVIEDVKGSAISPEARLKLACMQAMGLTVTLTS